MVKSQLKSFTHTALLLLTGCTRIGFTAPGAPLAVACRANPPAVFRSEPVTVTATGIGLNNPNVFYAWIGQGVTSSGETAAVNTESLVPGNYTVQVIAKEYKQGQKDQKAWRSANCSVTFTVK
jgi:hypothetical protein